jgi:hypothetical protein
VLEEVRLHDRMHATAPGIAGYVAFGRTGGGRSCVLQPSAGVCLEQLFMDAEQLDPAKRAGRAQLGPQQLLPTAYAAMQTLAQAHAQGHVHRDIKPEHLFVASHGVFQHSIIDWACQVDTQRLAAALAEGRRVSVATGTLGYMAPEMRALQRCARPSTAQVLAANTPAADVYSLGATLHYMLTGCLPPLKGPLSWPPLPADWPHLQQLQQLIASCLEPQPSARPSLVQLLVSPQLEWLRKYVAAQPSRNMWSYAIYQERAHMQDFYSSPQVARQAAAWGRAALGRSALLAGVAGLGRRCTLAAMRAVAWCQEVAGGRQRRALEQMQKRQQFRRRDVPNCELPLGECAATAAAAAPQQLEAPQQQAGPQQMAPQLKVPHQQEVPQQQELLCAGSIQQRDDTASRLAVAVAVAAAAGPAAAKAAPQSLAGRLRSLAGRVDALLAKRNPVAVLKRQQECNRGVGKLFNRFSSAGPVAVGCH